MFVFCEDLEFASVGRFVGLIACTGWCLLRNVLEMLLLATTICYSVGAALSWIGLYFIFSIWRAPGYQRDYYRS